jgi:hypothetical protein
MMHIVSPHDAIYEVLLVGTVRSGLSMRAGSLAELRYENTTVTRNVGQASSKA